MPLKIVRNDMTKMHVDAIANTPPTKKWLDSGYTIWRSNFLYIRAISKSIGMYSCIRTFTIACCICSSSYYYWYMAA